MKKVNLFIVGAPKSGTTALTEYLREHPQIFMSNPKEPHFFATDMKKHRQVSTIDEYKNLFKDINIYHKIIGEASVWYLYSEEAIKNIYEYNPEAKLIVMLRKPLEMVYSMHYQQLESFQENVKNFEKAWNLISLRKKGKKLPKLIRHIPNLYYDEIAKYDEQLKRVFKYFSKEQVHIILFDDFKKDTQKVYEKVLKFLDVEIIKKQEFKKINENTIVKSILLNEIAELQPKWFLDLKKKIGIKSFGIAQKIRQFNIKKGQRILLSKEFELKIISNYKKSVDNLSIMLNRDLSSWNKTSYEK